MTKNMAAECKKVVISTTFNVHLLCLFRQKIPVRKNREITWSIKVKLKGSCGN